MTPHDAILYKIAESLELLVGAQIITAIAAANGLNASESDRRIAGGQLIESLGQYNEKFRQTMQECDDIIRQAERDASDS